MGGSDGWHISGMGIIILVVFAALLLPSIMGWWHKIKRGDQESGESSKNSGKQIFCVSCGAANHADTQHCTQCGAPLVSAKIE